MKRKNILVFMTDQQNGDTQPPFYLGAYMPNLSRLWEHGVTFTQAYCPSPHCCPSRATFFTGLYPSRHGVWNNVNVSNALSRGLYDDIRLFSEDLKEAGYQVYFSGKWNVSATEGPDARGFDILFHPSEPKGGYHPYPNTPDMAEWNRYRKAGNHPSGDGQRAEGEIPRIGYPKYIQYGEKENPFQDEDTINAALSKIRDMGEDPFFFYVGPLGPHDPYFVPERFLDLYDSSHIKLPESFDDPMKDKPALYRRTRDRFARLGLREQKESLRHYLAFCSYEDALFGRVLDALEEKNLLDSTIVMYVSDHGDYAGAHGLWTKGLPCFREAYHICSTVGFGGVTPCGRYENAFISLADYAPTILELAGIRTGRNFSGKSFAPFLRGEQPGFWREELFTQTNGNELPGIQRAVFNQKYKYVYNGFDYDELYDLEKDPLEMKNIIHEPQSSPIAALLSRKLWEFAYDNKDNIVNSYITTALADYGPGILFNDETQRQERSTLGNGPGFDRPQLQKSDENPAR